LEKWHPIKLSKSTRENLEKTRRLIAATAGPKGSGNLLPASYWMGLSLSDLLDGCLFRVNHWIIARQRRRVRQTGPAAPTELDTRSREGDNVDRTGTDAVSQPAQTDATSAGGCEA